MHLLHDIILQAGIDYLESKTTFDDNEWSDSKRVDFVPCRMLSPHELILLDLVQVGSHADRLRK